VQISSSAQAPTGVRSAPTYTTAQAALGEAAYRTSWASCHGGNLDDGAFGPALKGVPFYAVLVPELLSPPDRSAMLWVFALP
jgi:mono/diheme cytochrome c family protein